MSADVWADVPMPAAVWVVQCAPALHDSHNVMAFYSAGEADEALRLYRYYDPDRAWRVLRLAAAVAEVVA